MYESFVTASDGERLRVFRGDWREAKPFLTLILPFGLRLDAAGTLCAMLSGEFNVVTPSLAMRSAARRTKAG